MIMDPQLVYYRPSMLEEAGLEGPPATMDDFLAYAAALDTGRRKGLYLGNDKGATPFLIYMATFASGTQLLDGTEVAFNTEENARMWEYKQQLANSDNLLVGAPTEWWDPSAFVDGLTAMQYIGLWAMPAIVEAHGDDVGVMPWPALDENHEPAIWIGTWNEAVNANSPHVEEAKAYVEWLWVENTEIQQDWNLSYGFHIPPRMSAAAEAEPLQSGPAAEVVALMQQYGQTHTPWWTTTMQGIYQDAHSEVIINNADPAAQLDQAAEAVRAEMDSLLNE